MKKKDEIKTGIILSYIIVFINIILDLIYIPILTRRLGQSEYGLYSLIDSFMANLIILDLGLSNSIILFTSRSIVNKDKKSEYNLNGVLFIIYCLISLITLFLGVLIFFNIENIFKNQLNIYEVIEAKKIIFILTINICLMFPLSMFSNILIAYEKFIFNKILYIIQQITGPIIIIFILYIYPKAWIIALITSIINILVLIINTIYVIIKIKIKISFKKLDFKILKEVFKYSFFIFLTNIIDKINWSIDKTTLGIIYGTISVSIYTIGIKIAEIYQSLSTAFSDVFLPKIIKMQEEKKSNKEFTDIFIKIGRMQFFILILFFSSFIIFGKNFINYWVGKEYYKSYYIAIISMLGGLIPYIEKTAIHITKAKNLYNKRTLILFVISILNIIITIPLIIKWNSIGAVIGTLISLIIGQWIVLNIFYYKKIGINVIKFFKEIVKIAIPIIILAITSFLIYNKIIPDNLVYLILSFIIYILLYFIIIWLFCMNIYEKNKIINIIYRKKK